MAYLPQLAQIASKHDSSLPLHFAASIGNVRVAGLLLEQYRAAACTANSKGKIPLHYAAREGRTEMVSFMLQMVPETASILSKKGKLALHFAAGEGHTEVVRELLRVHPKGATLPSKKGKIAIHFAARWGHMAIAKDLLLLFPDSLSSLDYDGSLPLHDAAREGQLEMAQFLVKRYPEGLGIENIRGETPLFPAIRSGNMDLCAFMVKAYPMGGKHVLRRVREHDNIQNWDEDLLDLCLRGAVDNFCHCSPFPQQDDLPDTSSTRLQSFVSTSDGEMLADHSDSSTSSVAHPAVLPSLASPILEITLPRSKSPILEEVESRKKRMPGGDNGSSKKKSRRGSCDGKGSMSALGASYHRPFHHVHAALQCGASPSVLHCVLERYPQQLQEIDDLGKLPLHWAVEYGSENIASIIIEKIWKPYKGATGVRDFLGRLPLHLALISKADCRIIKSLLDANPCSGVEKCGVLDKKFIDKLPLIMATEYGSDLSTMYMLLRCDPSIVQSWSCPK